jgi:hypothetical protein
VHRMIEAKDGLVVTHTEILSRDGRK